MEAYLRDEAQEAASDHHRFSVTVPEELQDRMDLRAVELGLNRSRYLVKLIREDIASLQQVRPNLGKQALG